MTIAPLQPAWYDPQGRREGRYALGPLLGHGGMGEVFEAWDTILARPVALKILRHLEPAAMIRFMQEAQLHARLDCPNICRIYDVDASNGAPRIAMQLIRGPNLEDASPELSLEQIITILIQVTDAIHAAHQLKLIHRDLKPSNILLQWAEGGWVPYICDFGLAMSLEGPSVTQPLAMTGTPAYMAPEQVRGDRSHICPATDVYGIGSTLYFTLTGRPPCVSTVTAEVLRVKRERRFPSPRSLEPEIPPDLETILLKCLQPDPGNRYPSAAELAEDLRRFQAGRPIQARPQQILRRLGSALRRRAPLLAAVAILTALAMGLKVMEGNRQHRQQRQLELDQYFTLEAANLEKALSNERMLPIHDLRPAYAQARARMEALRSRAAALGPDAEGPLRYALGRTHLFIRDFPAAQADLEKAWAAGYRTPETAALLARLQSWAYRQACEEATFNASQPSPTASAALAWTEEKLRQRQGLNCDPTEFTEALLAFARKDDVRAAGLAQASLNTQPWHLESAALASLSLSSLATERAGQGDLAGARTHYQEAQGAAQAALARGQNLEELFHAQAVAGRGLADLALERGELSLATLAELESQAGKGLLLAPQDPQAQSDWLRVRILKVRYQEAHGQDARRPLNEALQFFWTRTREPRPVALRLDHMALYHLQAQLDAAQGRDPMPALAEALKGAGHAVGLHRDIFGDLLNFKAGLEASRGQDPRPAVAAILARFQRPGAGLASASQGEIIAAAWITQATWERAAGLKTGASLQNARKVLQQVFQLKPASIAGHALLGQALVLEARAQAKADAGLATQAQWFARRTAPKARI